MYIYGAYLGALHSLLFVVELSGAYPSAYFLIWLFSNCGKACIYTVHAWAHIFNFWMDFSIRRHRRRAAAFSRGSCSVECREGDEWARSIYLLVASHVSLVCFYAFLGPTYVELTGAARWQRLHPLVAAVIPNSTRD